MHPGGRRGRRSSWAADPATAGAPAGEPAEPGLFGRPYLAASLTFGAVMLLIGFAGLAVVPTLPTAARELDGVALFPVVAGCFVAANLFGGVLGGHWADRAGAGRPLAVGMLLSVLALLVAGTSGTIWQLAAGRLVDGLAAGLVSVSVTTAIGRRYPERLRAGMLALLAAAWILPSLIGPPLAALVAAWSSWRTVFLGLAALTALPALALIAVLRRTGEQEPPAEPRADAEPEVSPKDDRVPVGAAAGLSAGAAVCQYGASGWSTGQLVALVVGGGLLGWFGPKVLPGGVGRAVRGLPVTVLLRGLSAGAFFTVEALVPLVLVTERQVPALVTGVGFTGAAVLWTVASWAQSKLRAAGHRPVVAGAGVLAVAVGLASAACLPGVSPLLGVAALPVAAVGMGFLTPALTVLSLRHGTRHGYATGAMQTAQNLGQAALLALASLVLNAVAALGGSALPGYAAAVALLLVPVALVAALAGRAKAV
ncbi:MFS transporter [Kitasatospora sp. MMS16-BH015]|uniref:MFS transporter n=1 Tax=Kitasatospora sp. MMS16-BH015 TaxID=2018025 RepID=UPI00352DDC1A